MINNFMFIDVISTISALLLFLIILFIPGYVIGWISNVLRFRTRHLIFKSIISIVLSTSTIPVIIYLLLKFLPSPILWLFYVLVVIVFVAIACMNYESDEIAILIIAMKNNRILLSIILVLGVIALLTIIDTSYDHKLYLSVMNYDYTTRCAIISAITRTGVPPVNPFLYPGFPIQLSYHYFWLMVCSVVERLSFETVSPRATLFGSTLWAALALISVILLYQKVIKGKSLQELKYISVISIGLLFVTGLDVLPILFGYLLVLCFSPNKLLSIIYPTIEWWNEQITGWLDSILWVPHHIVSLVACLLCLILIQSLNDNSLSRANKSMLIILCGLCCSSAFGLSIFVSFIFFVSLGIWLLLSIILKNYRDIIYLLLIGLCTLIILMPFLQELIYFHKAGPSPVLLTVRQIYAYQHIAEFLGIASIIPSNIINFILLPLNYFIECGAFLIIAYLYWKQNLSLSKIMEPKQLLEITVLVTSVIICSFIESRVTQGNDLGWRGFMFAQFILLIWSADYLNSLYTKYHSIKIIVNKLGIVGPLILIGFISTLFDLAMLRFYTIIMDSHVKVNNQSMPLGKRNYAIRQAYAFIDDNLPKNAIIQQNPDTSIDYGRYKLYFELYNGLYGRRQVIFSDKYQAAGFGGNKRDIEDATSAISTLFSSETSDVRQVANICSQYHISALIIKDIDSLWAKKDSWIWRLTPDFDNGYVKIFKFTPS